MSLGSSASSRHLGMCTAAQGEPWQGHNSGLESRSTGAKDAGDRAGRGDPILGTGSGVGAPGSLGGSSPVGQQGRVMSGTPVGGHLQTKGSEPLTSQTGREMEMSLY